MFRQTRDRLRPLWVPMKIHSPVPFTSTRVVVNRAEMVVVLFTFHEASVRRIPSILKPAFDTFGLKAPDHAPLEMRKLFGANGPGAVFPVAGS